MSTSICNTVAATPALPTSSTAANIHFLPARQLRTSYAVLRPGAPLRVPDDVAQLPIRVVPTDDGMYEVIDGFKRLGRWREQEHHLIPVVVEPPGTPADHKRLLLLANSPPRTLTALDEARVVCSLMSEEGIGPARVARILGHKPRWVARRVAIGTRLSPMAEDKLAQGAIGPTLAHALCALSAKEQEAVIGAMERHALKLRETLALLSAYRVADEPDRRELLRAPFTVVRPQVPSSPAISPIVTVLESRLEHIREALVSLADFTIPEELAPSEKRRLEARFHSVLTQLKNTACAHSIGQAAPNSTGDYDESEQRPERQLPQPISRIEAGTPEGCRSPGDSERDRTAAFLLRHQGDRSPGRMVAQDRSPHISREGVPSTGGTNSGSRQTRCLSPADRAEGNQRAHRHPDSTRNHRAGVLRGKEHSRRVCTNPAVKIRPAATQYRQAPLRNRTR